MRRCPPACYHRDYPDCSWFCPDAADDNQNTFSNSLCLSIAEENDRYPKTGISGLAVK